MTACDWQGEIRWVYTVETLKRQIWPILGKDVGVQEPQFLKMLKFKFSSFYQPAKWTCSPPSTVLPSLLSRFVTFPPFLLFHSFPFPFLPSTSPSPLLHFLPSSLLPYHPPLTFLPRYFSPILFLLFSLLLPSHLLSFSPFLLRYVHSVNSS